MKKIDCSIGILSMLLLTCMAPAVFSQAVFTETIPGTQVSFKMVLIPEGSFLMGSDEGDKFGESNERPQREVKLDSFWIGTHEVGYDEFVLFYHRENDNDSSRLAGHTYTADAVSRPTPQYIDYTYGMGKSGFPAVSMTQQAALRYCQWLYEKTGNFYRLPTEAEWEYACKSAAPHGLPDYAWYYNNSFEKYHEPGQKQPNSLGMYDMLGNVSEWTLDNYVEDYLANLPETGAANPWMEPQRRHSRTVKGGSYDSSAEDCRCAAREKSSPRWQARDPQIPKSIWWNPDAPFVGFRLVRPVKSLSPEDIDAFFAKAIKD